ncbi:ATP-NAD kinase-like domain-containing protein, partial [Lineolata rhizophorae]
TRSLTTSPPSLDLHVLVSTHSGARHAAAFRERVLSPLLSLAGLSTPAHYTVHTTSSPRSISELTRTVFRPAAHAGRAQLIALLSGDGGVVDVLNALHFPSADADADTATAADQDAQAPGFKRPAIALLPLGTGNALANSLGIAAADATFGLSALARGAPRALPAFAARFSAGARMLVDEGRATEELPLRLPPPAPAAADADGKAEAARRHPALLGAVVASWALHAALVADSDSAEYRARFGPERFQVAARELLFPEGGGGAPHEFRGRVADRQERREEWADVPGTAHAYVLLTLVSHLERGFCVSPSSAPFAPRPHLVHLPPLSGGGADVMRVMGLAYQGGKHVGEEQVQYEEVDGMRITFEESEERWRRVCVDGKIVVVEEGGWVEVRMWEGREDG